MKKWLILFPILFVACAGPVNHLYPIDADERPISTYVISHGWHVGFAVESEHLKPHLPFYDQLPTAKYLMFGWGDRRYFPDRDAGVGLMLRAALLPTNSVIHVVGIDRPIEQYFRYSTIVKVMITETGTEQMGKFVASQFSTSNERIVIAAKGLYPNSLFFEAKESYYFPNTSNKWTARALRETGFPISPFYAVSSGNVIRQVSKHGEIIQESEDN